ncbi:MAG: DedA family protein [Bacteroidales bacterium]|nr:DedA family protein [Bacteroidales bacterium]
MHELFDFVIKWYETHLNYGTITLLMAIESSFIPFPSEIVIPPAAYLAHSGQMKLSLIVLFSTIGCLIGALVNYVLSYTLGRKIIYALANTKWARLFLISQEKIENAEKFFIKNGNVSTLIGRLVPAVRQLISIPAGLAKMSMKNFLLYTAIGSGLWNIILALLSYFLIDKWEVYYKEISWGFVVLAIGFIGFLIFKALKKSKERKAIA